MRDPMDEENLTPEQKAIYLPGNDKDARRMAALRQKILNTPSAHVITYSLECNSGKTFPGSNGNRRTMSLPQKITSVPLWNGRRF